MLDNDFRIPALQLQTSLDVEEECVTVRRSIPEESSTYLKSSKPGYNELSFATTYL